MGVPRGGRCAMARVTRRGPSGGPDDPLRWFSVRVGRHLYTVDFATWESHPMLSFGCSDGSPADAVVSPALRSIVIDAALDKRRARVAAMHELMHAVAHAASYWPAEMWCTHTDATMLSMLEGIGFKMPPFPRGWQALRRRAIAIKRRKKA